MGEDNRNGLADTARQVDYDPRVKYREKETFGKGGDYSFEREIEGPASLIGQTAARRMREHPPVIMNNLPRQLTFDSSEDE
jgi:hypothetical protein